MKFKVIFIGGLTNGNSLLKYLNNDQDTIIELVITYPKEIKNPRSCEIKEKDYKKVIYDTDVSKYKNVIKKIKPDFIFVCGWSFLVAKSIFDLSNIAAIGFHPSKLPKDRGRSVLAWQIEEGYTETALTIFHLNEKVDAGDIIDQISISINNDETVNDILNKIDHETINLIKKNYSLLKTNKANRIAQDEKKSTYRILRNSSNSLISWNLDAQDIHNKIRAITKPYVGAEGYLGKQKYKFWKSEISKKQINDLNYKIGDFHIENNYIKVKCRDKFIYIVDYEKL